MAAMMNRIMNAPMPISHFVVLPVLKVPGFQHLFDEPQEPIVVDSLRQDSDHYFMVQGSKAVGDVSLDEPRGSGPGRLYLPQCGVASPVGSEPV